MPTILLFGAFRVMIFPNDHEPPHVHVFGSGGIILFYLHCSEDKVSLRETVGIKKSDERKIAQFLTKNLGILCAAWEKFHGDR